MNQINTELEAYRLLSEARDILAPYADKADTDLGADPELGKIWDELRAVKVRFMRRLVVRGLLKLEEVVI